MTSSYGFEVRKKKQLKEFKELRNEAYEFIQQLWEETELVISVKTIQEFYLQVDAQLRSEFTTPFSYRISRVQLLKFIRQYNKQNKIPLPEPALPFRLIRESPIKELDWMSEGRKISLWAKLAMEYWSKHQSYTHGEALGWTLFSAVIWGGLNDLSALKSFLKLLTSEKPLFIFNQKMIILHLDAEDARYGNVTHPVKNTLFRSFSFIPDSLTLCWMTRLKSMKADTASHYQLEELFQQIFHLLKIKVNNYSISKEIRNLLKFASYHWEQLDQVQVNQALVRVLTQQQNACSLSETEFAHFYAPILSLNGLMHLSLTELLKGKLPTQIKKNKASAPEKNARNVTKEIRHALQQNRPEEALAELAESLVNESTIRLVLWIRHLVLAENSRKLKSSSIARYMDAVAHPWLIRTYGEDVNEYDELDFENLYLEILDNRIPSLRSFDAMLLARFHKFQMDFFDVPSTNIPGGHLSQTHVRASVISPSLYHAMIATIKNDPSLLHQDSLTFQLLIMMAYRTGLRREELVKLQFRDIEYGEQLSFIIRASATGTIKTASAFRRIPVWALLLSDELEILRRYLKDGWIRHKRMAAVIFTTSNSAHKLPSELPSRLLNTLIEQIMPSARYSFHSFRHTAISNLALILISRESLTLHLTDYRPVDCARIRNALLGQEHQGQDRWFALAQVAGHLTPNHTFEHYVHFAHLIACHEINAAPLTLPSSAVQNITGYSTQKFSRIAPKMLINGIPTITLNFLHPVLLKDIAAKTYNRPVYSDQGTMINIDQNDRNKFNSEFYNRIFDLLPDGDAHPIPMLAIQKLLLAIEKGEPLDVAADMYKIHGDLAQRWLVRASQLAQLSTQNGESRLFTKERLKKSNNFLLAPTLPPSRKEQEIIEICFDRIRKLNIEDLAKFQQFLDLFFDRITATKSEIRFKIFEGKQLKYFFEVGRSLIDLKNWRLKAPTIEEARSLKKELGLPELLSIYDDPYNGYSLSIKHPLEEEICEKSGVQKTSSSGLLKYVCHMLAIVDHTYAINK